MGKKRFVEFSVATSVAATRGAASQATSMIDAAITATLPKVGRSGEFKETTDPVQSRVKSGRFAAE